MTLMLINKWSAVRSVTFIITKSQVIKETFSFVIINSGIFVFTAQSTLQFSRRNTFYKGYILLSPR